MFPDALPNVLEFVALKQPTVLFEIGKTALSCPIVALPVIFGKLSLLIPPIEAKSVKPCVFTTQGNLIVPAVSSTTNLPH